MPYYKVELLIYDAVKAENEEKAYEKFMDFINGGIIDFGEFVKIKKASKKTFNYFSRGWEERKK